MDSQDFTSNNQDPTNDQELSVEELEDVAGGTYGDSPELPSDINTNCGGNCNC